MNREQRKIAENIRLLSAEAGVKASVIRGTATVRLKSGAGVLRPIALALKNLYRSRVDTVFAKPNELLVIVR